MSRSSEVPNPGRLIPGTGVENPIAKSDADPTRRGRHNALATSQIDSQTPARPLIPEEARRCEEKGCIFPVAGVGKKCLIHHREAREAKHFKSSQPTVLMLEQARFGLPDPATEPDDSRFRDRRREMTEREAFFEEAA